MRFSISTSPPILPYALPPKRYPFLARCLLALIILFLALIITSSPLRNTTTTLVLKATPPYTRTTYAGFLQVTRNLTPPYHTAYDIHWQPLVGLTVFALIILIPTALFLRRLLLPWPKSLLNH